MKKEGNHKRAQRVQKGVKAESYKKGTKSVSELKKERRKGQKRKRKTAKKKVSKIRVVVVGAPKSIKKYKKKTKILSGFSPLKLKPNQSETTDDSDKSEQKAAASNKREREREDGTAA